MTGWVQCASLAVMLPAHFFQNMLSRAESKPLLSAGPFSPQRASTVPPASLASCWAAVLAQLLAAADLLGSRLGHHHHLRGRGGGSGVGGRPTAPVRGVVLWSNCKCGAAKSQQADLSSCLGIWPGALSHVGLQACTPQTPRRPGARLLSNS